MFRLRKVSALAIIVITALALQLVPPRLPVAHAATFPDTTITYPTWNEADLPGELPGYFEGLATDDAQVQTVQITARREIDACTPAPVYWNGSAWQSDPCTLAPASLGSGTTERSWRWNSPSWLGLFTCEQGVYTISAAAVDDAGNVDSTAATTTFTYTAPRLEQVSAPSGWTTDTTPALTVEVRDCLYGMDYVDFSYGGAGGSAYSGRLVLSSTAVGATISCDYPWGGTSLPSDGEWWLDVRAYNKYGSCSGKSWVVRLDTRAPHTYINTMSPIPTYTKVVPGEFYGQSTDGGSGVADVSVNIQRPDGAGGTEYWGGSAWNGSADTWLTAINLSSSPAWGNWGFDTAGWLTTDGTYTVQARATDALGHVDATPATLVFTLDRVAPTISDCSPASGSWVNGTPSIQFTATDALSGPATSPTLGFLLDGDTDWTYVSGSEAWTDVGGGVFQMTWPDGVGLPEGHVQLWFSCLDQAGNQAMYAYYVDVDLTAPEVSITTPADGAVFTDASSCYNFAGSASDTVGLIRFEFGLQRDSDGFYWSGAGWVADRSVTGLDFSPPWTAINWNANVVPTYSDGTFTGTAMVRDRAGNEATRSVSFTLDTTAPTISDCQPAADVWLNTATPTIQFTATDALSGPATSPTLGFQLVGDADWTYVSGTEAWTNLGGGVFQMTWPVGVELPEGHVQLRFSCLDQVGNEATHSYYVDVDLTAPEVIITTPADGAIFTDASSCSSFTGSASDSGGLSRFEFGLQRDSDGFYWSGADWVAGPFFSGLDFSSPVTASPWTVGVAPAYTDGTFTFTARVRDRAQNEATRSVGFTLDTTPPTQPTGLTVTADGTTGLDLTWTPSTDAATGLAGYDVYGSDSETGTFAKLNAALLTGPAYSETGLAASTTRWYYVVAVDAVGHESTSATVSGTTQAPPPTTPPPPPRIGPELRTAIRLILAIGSGQANLNGYFLDLDAPPFIQNGRTMVPLRFISEALGAQVSWNPYTQQITIRGDWTEIVLTVGSNIALVNGEPVEIDAPVILKGAPEWRTYVPFRFICEALGAEVTWDPVTRTVRITR